MDPIGAKNDPAYCSSSQAATQMLQYLPNGDVTSEEYQHSPKNASGQWPKSISGRSRSKVNQSFASLAAELPPSGSDDSSLKSKGEILRRSTEYLKDLLAKREKLRANLMLSSPAQLRQCVHNILRIQEPSLSPASLQSFRGKFESTQVSSPQETRHESSVHAGTDSRRLEALFKDSGRIDERLAKIFTFYCESYCLSRGWKYAEVWLPHRSPAMRGDAAQSSSSGALNLNAYQTTSPPKPHSLFAQPAPNMYRYSAVYNAENSQQLTENLKVFETSHPDLSSRVPGLAQRIYIHARPEYLSHLHLPNNGFHRYRGAAISGLRTAIAVPQIDTSGHILAVLIFFDTVLRDYSIEEIEKLVGNGRVLCQAFHDAVCE